MVDEVSRYTEVPRVGMWLADVSAESDAVAGCKRVIDATRPPGRRSFVFLMIMLDGELMVGVGSHVGSVL